MAEIASSLPPLLPCHQKNPVLWRKRHRLPTSWNPPSAFAPMNRPWRRNTPRPASAIPYGLGAGCLPRWFAEFRPGSDNPPHGAGLTFASQSRRKRPPNRKGYGNGFVPSIGASRSILILRKVGVSNVLMMSALRTGPLATPDHMRKLADWYRDWAKAGNDDGRKWRLDLADQLEKLATDLEQHVQRESADRKLN